MLFKRRTQPSWAESLRVWLWPRRSWLRSTQYVTKRVLRITATPHAIAAGVAAGVFTSFTPFMGLHFLVAFALAWLIGGNLIASALGTFFGNPLSFPFIWAATFHVGNFLLGMDQDGSGALLIATSMSEIVGALFSFDMSAAGAGITQIWEPVLYPMLIGGAVLGPVFAVPFYFITRRGTAAFRERRRDSLMRKAEMIRDRARQLESSGFAGEAS